MSRRILVVLVVVLAAWTALNLATRPAKPVVEIGTALVCERDRAPHCSEAP